MSITITLEATRRKCHGCDALLEEDAEVEQAYECGNCGTQFGRDDSPSGNHQCPDCNKFAAKMDPDEGGVCPECRMVNEVEEVYVITCVCHDEEHEVYV